MFLWMGESVITVSREGRARSPFRAEDDGPEIIVTMIAAAKGLAALPLYVFQAGLF